MYKGVLVHSVPDDAMIVRFAGDPAVVVSETPRGCRGLWNGNSETDEKKEAML